MYYIQITTTANRTGLLSKPDADGIPRPRGFIFESQAVAGRDVLAEEDRVAEIGVVELVPAVARRMGVIR